MSVEGLHRDLLAIPGVADAFVEGEAAAPTGVRVRLAVAADPDAVGTAVQRLLESRGMRSRVAAPAAAPTLPPVLMAAPDLPEAHVLEIATEAAAETGEEPDPEVRPDAIAGLAALSIEESASEVLVVATSTTGSRFSRRTAALDEPGVAAATLLGYDNGAATFQVLVRSTSALVRGVMGMERFRPSSLRVGRDNNIELTVGGAD